MRRTDIGVVLRRIRREQRVDQLSLALAMGASSAAYLSRLERGGARNPSVGFIARLVRAYAELGCPLTEPQREQLARAVLAVRPPGQRGVPAVRTGADRAA